MSQFPESRPTGLMRNREIRGAKRLGPVRKAIAVKSTVVAKTFRKPSTTDPPNVGSKKYFCPNSQLKSSRAEPAAAHSGNWEGGGSSLCQGSALVISPVAAGLTGSGLSAALVGAEVTAEVEAGVAPVATQFWLALLTGLP